MSSRTHVQEHARARTHTHVFCIHYNEMNKLENDTTQMLRRVTLMCAVNTRTVSNKAHVELSLTVDSWQKFCGCRNAAQISCLRERVHSPRLLASVVA